MSSTKTHTLEKDVEAPLLDGPKQPMRPAPIRAIHAGLQFVFIVFGKEYGWAGFCLLVVGTAFSVATSVHVNWLGGCAVMMVFFACTFCFAGYQAVSGKYELARPLMFGAMMMFLSCILGGHFFVVWSKSASSQVIKDVPLSGLPKVTPAYDENALFYLKDGSVGTGQTGAFKLCKDKLPVVGTCVYNYYCVAPILADGYSKGADVLAWVGIMAHVPCDDATFLKSPARMAWNHDYRSGLGIERNKHWDSAIDESVKKYGLVTNDHAPVINWMPNPTEEEQRAWHMGWMVESIVFMIYLVAMAIYSYTVGFTEEALPEARKIMDPEAPLKPPRRKKLDITVKK
mmetsp:Transcript_28432/g.70411  ORF Transcript_28432/g.70411 Transcript_28432/m.70411 type:complete len:343 (-) Transcript_28432:1320-2348(-)